eukprot:Sdes_comp18593_c0_seq2m8737
MAFSPPPPYASHRRTREYSPHRRYSSDPRRDSSHSERSNEYRRYESRNDDRSSYRSRDSSSSRYHGGSYEREPADRYRLERTHSEKSWGRAQDSRQSYRSEEETRTRGGDYAHRGGSSFYYRRKERFGYFSFIFSLFSSLFLYKTRPFFRPRLDEKDQRESKTLFVGNIPYDFIEKDIQELFERFGQIRAISIPIDDRTGKNKGFSFVEFQERLDAEDALGRYNGYRVSGRNLRLDWDAGLEKKQSTRHISDHENSRSRSRSGSPRNRR